MLVFSLVLARRGSGLCIRLCLITIITLLVQIKRQKLRSQRSVQEADKKLISQIRKGGMKPAQVFEFMVQFYGGADKVPFSRMDCNK
jgi:hypothetical protein